MTIKRTYFKYSFLGVLSLFISVHLHAANFEVLVHFIEEGQFVDKIFRSKTNNDFPFHSVILAAYSPYFQKMFTGFKERDQNVINLPYSNAAIKTILDLAYNKPVNEAIKDLDVNTYLELISISQQAFLTTLSDHLKNVPLLFGDDTSDQEILEVLNLKDQDLLDRIFAKSHIVSITIFRQEHRNCLESAAINNDRTKIVIGNNGNFAKVFEAANGSELLTLTGHKSFVPRTAFSSDGKLIATASNDDTVKVFDAASGKERYYLQGNGVWATHALAFSSDSKKLIFGDYCSLHIFDSANGNNLSTFPEITRGATSTSFSPDGKRFVISDKHGSALVFDSTSGEVVSRLRGYSGEILSAVFNKDGTKLLIATANEIAWVHNAIDGKRLLKLGHNGRVYTAAFNSDDTLIVTGANDHIARVFDAVNGRELLQLQHPETVYLAAFVDDKKLIIVSSNHHQIWALPPRELYDNQYLQESDKAEKWLIVKVRLDNYLKSLKENVKPSYKTFIAKASKSSKTFAYLLQELINKNNTLKSYLEAVFGEI